MAEIQFAKLKLKSEFGHNGFTWRRVQQKGCCNNKNKFNAIRTDDKTVKKFFKVRLWLSIRPPFWILQGAASCSP